MTWDGFNTEGRTISRREVEQDWELRKDLPRYEHELALEDYADFYLDYQLERGSK